MKRLPARSAVLGVAAIAAIAAIVVSVPASAGTGVRNGVIVFSSGRAQGALEIFSMRPDGSSPRRLTESEPSVQAASWSPDGKRIALFTFLELWLMRRDGTGLRRVAGGIESYGVPPAWSPDGRRLAFACPAGSAPDSPQPICVVRTDGTRRKRITELRRDQSDRSPTWSPDGKQIAFARYRRGNYHLFVLDLRTGKSHRLTRTRRDLESNPSWSRHGEIAYRYVKALRGDDYANADIYVMRGDGSAKRRLTRTPKIDEDHFSWSPDARKIAYERSDTIYVVDRDGTDAHRILSTTLQSATDGLRSAGLPAWSPDGRKFAFVDEATYWLWLMSRDGTNAAPLLRSSQSSTPAVTMDGSTIGFRFHDAYAYSEGECRACFFLMNVDGSNRRVAAGGPHPSWSPDGGRVAFESDDSIEIVTLDGSGHELFQPPEHTGWSEPAWSPNGDSIAVSQFAGGSHAIYLVSLDGATTRLTRGASPAWSPDGKRIAFVRGSTIRIANSSNGGGERKVVAKGVDPVWSPDGTKLAFVRYLGQNSEIFVVNVNGTGLKRLTHNPAPDLQPAWQALR